MNYLDRLQKNVQLSYIFNVLLFFRTTNAIWLIYLGFKGISLTQIGILESIFHITSFIFEVPTGAFADIFGKKISVLCGRIASIISGCLMIGCDSMWGFSLAFVFSGLAYTLNSGAGTSIVYDSLLQRSEQHRYTIIFGTMVALGEISQAVAVGLGGYLADISFVYAYIVTLVVDVLAILVIVDFTEPQIVKACEQRQSFIAHTKSSIKILLNTKTVLFLMIYFSIISATGTTVYFYCQKHFEAMNYSCTVIAIIFSMDSLLRAVCAKYAYKAEAKFEQTSIIVTLLMLIILGLLGLGSLNGFFAVICYYIISVADGIGYPIFSHYINSLIPAEQRATLLSLESTMFSISMIIIFSTIGFLSDITSIGLAFMMLAVFIGLVVMVVVYLICTKQDTA